MTVHEKTIWRLVTGVFGLAVALGFCLITAQADEEPHGTRCLRQQLRAYEAMAVPVDPGTPTTGDPPPDPGVGDTWNWYIWHLAGPPWAEELPCTIRGEGEHVYVVVEDSQ
jgi:hypothetical protein